MHRELMALCNDVPDRNVHSLTSLSSYSSSEYSELTFITTFRHNLDTHVLLTYRLPPCLVLSKEIISHHPPTPQECLSI